MDRGCTDVVVTYLTLYVHFWLLRTNKYLSLLDSSTTLMMVNGWPKLVYFRLLKFLKVLPFVCNMRVLVNFFIIYLCLFKKWWSFNWLYNNPVWIHRNCYENSFFKLKGTIYQMTNVLFTKWGFQNTISKRSRWIICADFSVFLVGIKTLSLLFKKILIKSSYYHA